MVGVPNDDGKNSEKASDALISEFVAAQDRVIEVLGLEDERGLNYSDPAHLAVIDAEIAVHPNIKDMFRVGAILDMVVETAKVNTIQDMCDAGIDPLTASAGDPVVQALVRKNLPGFNMDS